jgi:hypothetical protein
MSKEYALLFEKYNQYIQEIPLVHFRVPNFAPRETTKTALSEKYSELGPISHELRIHTLMNNTRPKSCWFRFITQFTFTFTFTFIEKKKIRV